MARITETAAGKGGVFAGAALLWLVLDRATKAYFEGAYALGQTSAHDWLIVRFRLIHNTGAAWGAFGDSTVLLGAFSLAVCIAIVCAFAFYGRVSGRNRRARARVRGRHRQCHRSVRPGLRNRLPRFHVHGFPGLQCG